MPIFDFSDVPAWEKTRVVAPEGPPMLLCIPLPSDDPATECPACGRPWGATHNVPYQPGDQKKARAKG